MGIECFAFSKVVDCLTLPPLRHGRLAVPHFRVEVAGGVPQRHIQILVSLGGLPLLRHPDEQEARKTVVFAQ